MRSNSAVRPRSLAVLGSIAALAIVAFFPASGALADNAQALRKQPPLPQPNSATTRQPILRFTPPAHRRGRDSRPHGWLNQADEIATLYAIHTALSSVGDGGAYVWRRGNGLLDALIRPTTSFKSQSGDICRHIVIRLNSKHYSREIEGIACRDATGQWSLSG